MSQTTKDKTGPAAAAKQAFQDRVLLAVVAIACLAGAVLRFAPRSGLWLDEALSVNISRLPVGQITEALRHDGHPPLFYFLLHYWSSLFGDSDWSVRAMSGVFSVATLPLFYLIGARIADRSEDGRLGRRRTGLLVMAVGSVMPFAVRYGAEARMYSIVAFLSAIGYLVVDDLLNGRHSGTGLRLRSLAAAFVAAAMLWTHYWSLWLLGAVGLLALWRSWRETDPDRRSGARHLVAALIVGGVLFTPWLPNLLYQSAHTGTPWGVRYGPASVLVITIVDFAGGRFGAAQLLTYILIPLVLIALLVAFGRPARENSSTEEDQNELVIKYTPVPLIRTEMAIFILTLAIGWAAAAASGNTFSSRYSSVVFPLFVAAIGSGLAMFRRQLATLIVLIAVIALCLFGAVGATRADRSQNGELAQAIVDDAATTKSASVVIACPDQLGVSLQRELEHRAPDTLGKQEVLPYPAGGSPDFIDWVDYGERNEKSSPEAFIAKFKERIPDAATVYLVASTQYKTFEGKCEALISLLGRGREATNPIAMNIDGLDESAALWIFRPST